MNGGTRRTIRRRSDDMIVGRLKASLADRYHIDREIGAGGMATRLAADSRAVASAMSMLD